MARPAYSKLLGTLTSVSDPELVGVPPDGYLWVVRFASMTVGSYIGFVRGGFSIANTDPWLYLMGNQDTAVWGIHAQTFYWEGRVVVPAGEGLWARVEDGDTGDFLFSGYELSVSGA